MPTFRNWQSAQDNIFLFYACFCGFMLFLRVAVAFYVPDIPLKHSIIVRRHEAIAYRCMFKEKKKLSKILINPKIYFVHTTENYMNNQ